MSQRISKSSQSEEMTTDDPQMALGRSLSPPAFNLTTSNNDQPPGGEMASGPIQAKSEEGQTEEADPMFEATQLLKILDHVDVILDLKDAITPSLTSIVKRVMKIKSFVNSLSEVRKGASLTPQSSLSNLKVAGKSLGFAVSAIEMTYWATVKGAKLLARGVYAGQELSGQISSDQYENAVDNLEDSVPDSMWALLMMPSETYQSFIKIKRLSKDILEDFSTLSNLKKSLQKGDASMLDVVKTVSNLKDSLEDFVELCREVQELLEDLGFEVELKPLEKAINKFSYPLKSMKGLINEDKPEAKKGNNDTSDGGWSSLKKSVEPGYKPILDAFSF